MPNSPAQYGGTITFDSNMSLERKWHRINNIHNMLSEYLSFKGDKEYYLKYTVEYHKVEGRNDPEAPHVHFILYSSSVLPNYRLRSINEMLKKTCGRSQFYRMTSMKLASYEKYIQKDVESSDLEFQRPHSFEIYLEPNELDIYSLLIDALDEDYDIYFE